MQIYFLIALEFHLTNFIAVSLVTPSGGYPGPPDASWPSSAGPWGSCFKCPVHQVNFSQSVGNKKVWPGSPADFQLPFERLQQNKLFELLAFCFISCNTNQFFVFLVNRFNIFVQLEPIDDFEYKTTYSKSFSFAVI